VRPSARSRLLLVLGSIGLSLAVAEIGLRAAGYGEPRADELRVGDDGLPSPRLRGGPVEDTRLGVFYTVDPDGFRTPPGPPEAPDGSPLVAFVGDSFVFGICVEDGDTLPLQVKDELGARGTRVRVVNWGVPGANTHQQAEVVGRRLPAERPDVLVLVVIENDAEVMPWNPDPLTDCGLEVTALDRAGRWLLEHVYLYRLGARAFFPCWGPEHCGRYRFDNDWPTGRCFASSFDAILDEAAAAGAHPLVVYYPQVTRDPCPLRRHPERARARAIEAMTREAGADYLSMVELFCELDPLDISCERPDGTRERHPSPHGNRVAAGAIADDLEGILGD